MLVAHPKLAQLDYLAKLSATLEKVAEVYRDNPEVCQRALTIKIAADNEAFELIKQAMSPWVKPIAWGLGIGIPMTAGGAFLIDRLSDKAEETAAKVRNQTLLTALGVALIGGGLYGAHRLFSGPSGTKRASAHALPAEAIKKLATVGLIEGLLDSLPKNSPIQKIASEVRILNRGYGMRLLYEITQ